MENMAISLSSVCGTSSDGDIDYDSGISMNGQDEIEELEKLVREQLEDDGGLAWKLEWSPLGGRGVIARSSIKPGEVIFTNPPLVLGPRGGMEGKAICVACFKSGALLKACSNGCRLPICSPSCQDRHSESPVCRRLLKLGVQEGDSWSLELYRALMPFFCLDLSKRDKRIIKVLQAHPPNGLATEVKLLKRALKSELPPEDEVWMDRCCRVLDAVAFQVIMGDFDSQQSPLRGIYPLAGLLNHSCMPNTRQVFDEYHRLKVIAVKPIVRGEEITISYCPILWATPLRITFLLKTKQFICSCQRCCDPTEMGTYLAGLVCACGGMVLPVEPQKPKSEWKCTCCTRSLSSGQALVASSILFTNLGKSKNNLSLTQNNQMVVDSTLKAIFSQRKALKDMKDTELAEREANINNILQLLHQLQLGECRTKGLLLNELFGTLKEKGLRCPDQRTKDNRELIVEADRILNGDISVPRDILESLKLKISYKQPTM